MVEEYTPEHSPIDDSIITRLLKDVGASENFSYDGKNYRLAGYLPDGSAECIELNELGGGILRINLPNYTQVT